MSTVEPVEPGQVHRVEALLSANDLPHRDVGTDAVDLYGVVEDGALVGAGGLERRGSVALLRSVVVAEPHRGRGLGSRLCDALEDVAGDRGVEALYLLTTTAAAFFRARGYAEVARSEVPPPIRDTAEFGDLCPTTATSMRKRLG